MATVKYNLAKKKILDSTLNLSTATLKVMLVNNTYTPNADHDYVDMGGANDPCDAELNGTGYQGGFSGTGRKTLSSKTFEEDDPNDRGEVHADNLIWSGINAGTVAGAILYAHGTSDADSVLIAFTSDGGFPITTNGGDLALNWNAEGLLQLT